MENRSEEYLADLAEEKALLSEYEAKHKTGEASSDELLELAALYNNDHRENEAIRILREILETEPNNIWASIFLCDLLLMHNWTFDCATEIDRLITQITEVEGEWSAAGYHLLGWLNSERAINIDDVDYQEEQRLHHRAIGIAPDWPLLHSNIAWTYHRLGKHSEAEKSMGRAIALRAPIDTAWPRWRRYLENMVTGRISTADWYESELKRMMQDRMRSEGRSKMSHKENYENCIFWSLFPVAVAFFYFVSWLTFGELTEILNVQLDGLFGKVIGVFKVGVCLTFGIWCTISIRHFIQSSRNFIQARKFRKLCG